MKTTTVCISILLLAIVLSLFSTVEGFGNPDLPVSKRRCGPKFGAKCQPTKCCSLWGFCGPPGTDHCKFAAPEQYQGDPAPYEPPGWMNPKLLLLYLLPSKPQPLPDKPQPLQDKQ